jgi:hypothetical protein
MVRNCRRRRTRKRELLSDQPKATASHSDSTNSEIGGRAATERPAGRMWFEHKATPVCIDERVAFAPVDLLASIVTAWPAGLGGLDALAVNDRGRRAGVAPDPFPICHNERVVYQFEAPFVAPGSKPAVNRPLWRQVVRQQAPRAARPRDIEYPVDDLALAKRAAGLWYRASASAARSRATLLRSGRSGIS